jgi:hypothetical protein
MKKHELKTWPEYFEAVLKKKKTFELRKNDRDFKVGDTLILREFIPCDKCNGTGRVWDVGDMTNCGCGKLHGKYTGRAIMASVTYIFAEGEEFGLEEGYVIMSIKFLSNTKFK